MTTPTTSPAGPFTAWLLQRAGHGSPLGDLARDASHDRCWREPATRGELVGYLRHRGACREAIATAERAWRRFEASHAPELLEARGWRRHPGGLVPEGAWWVDPCSSTAERPEGCAWPEGEAARMQRDRDTFAPLYAAGWRAAGTFAADREDAPTGIAQLRDPSPGPSEGRWCSLRAAFARQLRRDEAAARGIEGES